MTPALREDVARRFPLAPRGRPACHPLGVRVRQVTDLADTASWHPAETARIACEAHNLAALIASDCGLPAPQLAHAIETDVLRSQDAYAAREVLAHPGCASRIPASTIEALTGLVDVSGLGRGAIPTGLSDQLTAAITAAETSLIAALAVAADA